MAKCQIGPRKVAALEKLTGRKIKSAWTRGGWPHDEVMVFFADDTERAMWVNKKTGAIEPYDDAEPGSPAVACVACGHDIDVHQADYVLLTWPCIVDDCDCKTFQRCGVGSMPS